MSVREQAIEDGVGEGRVCDGVVPGIDGKLTGHDSRAKTAAIFEDVEQIGSFRLRQF